MARDKMKTKGFRQINKHGKNKKANSYFANHWREFLPSYKQPA